MHMQMYVIANKCVVKTQLKNIKIPGGLNGFRHILGNKLEVS